MSRFQLKAVHRSKLLERYAHLNDSAEFLPYVFSADEGDDDLTARMEWLERFTTQSFPRPNIPRGLKLVRSHSFQPRFLYGWALDRSTMYKLGMQIGFVDPIPLENLERTSTTPGISLFHATVRLDRWLNQYLPETMKHLKWVTIEAVRGQHFQLRPDRLKYCIALSDSYVSGNRKPDPTWVEVLRIALCIGTDFTAFADNKAMWWVDVEHQQWEWCSYKDFLSSNRHLSQVKNEMVALQRSSSGTVPQVV